MFSHIYIQTNKVTTYEATAKADHEQDTDTLFHWRCGVVLGSIHGSIFRGAFRC